MVFKKHKGIREVRIERAKKVLRFIEIHPELSRKEIAENLDIKELAMKDVFGWIVLWAKEKRSVQKIVEKHEETRIERIAKEILRYIEKRPDTSYRELVKKLNASITIISKSMNLIIVWGETDPKIKKIWERYKKKV
tara:strand:+ start:2097 stop:2507 length:411 start_codon:yes stop_codon:yes gene_type:complete